MSTKNYTIFYVINFKHPKELTADDSKLGGIVEMPIREPAPAGDEVPLLLVLPVRPHRRDEPRLLQADKERILPAVQRGQSEKVAQLRVPELRSLARDRRHSKAVHGPV